MARRHAFHFTFPLLRVIAAAGALIVQTVNAEIFVLNNVDGTVGKYDDSGAAINPAFITGLRNPASLVLHNGFFYIAQQYSVVSKYTQAGALVNPAWISGLVHPKGMAISSNLLYVTTGSNVATYTLQGALVNPALVSGLSVPNGLEVVGNHLFVSEWSGNRVGKYTVDGATVNRSFIRAGLFPSGIGAVVSDRNGNLYVSFHDDGVRRYDVATGAAHASVVPKTYNTGLGLALDASGNLYYAHNYGGGGGNRILKYTTSGTLLNDTFIVGLRNPVALVVIPGPVATNQSPIANAGPDRFIECSGSTTRVALDGRASSDLDGDPLQFQWWHGQSLVASGVTADVFLGSGTHEIRLIVTDSAGYGAEDTFRVTIGDTTAPVINALTALPSVLWPPNLKFVPVAITTTLEDNCDSTAAARIVSVECNEPARRGIDWEVTGALSLNLRADRAGTGAGRNYIITVEAGDSAGNRSTKVVTVRVPHSLGPAR